MGFIKRHISTILLATVFVIGLSMLLYPTFADWWNSWNGARLVDSYTKQVENSDDATIEQIWNQAVVYNSDLVTDADRFHFTEEEHARYLNSLVLPGEETNILGSISIPSIKVNLPIYHGTDEKVLNSGAGHLEGSSLPIGGVSTHSVITGHRGLPSAKLFTDLDKMVEGDYIIIRVLNRTLTYQLDTIRIVEPQEIESLAIETDKDLLTLVTCTPYGVNTHRMLLTGHRVDNLSDWEAVSDAGQIDAKMVALFIAIPILAGLFIWLMIYYRKPRGDSDEED